ncbi:acylphosphatase [Candidatus Pacearchaeota archaeon]|nr:acylphosphatase [Candidatus Pacearchaeota archaeon]
MIKTVKITVTGIVHGVFFRQMVKENADALHLRGYVRNYKDGRAESIEVIAEGKNDNVQQLIEICRRGTPHSKIKEVKIQEMKNQDFKDFRISYL